jgi:hypothetical protein
MPLAALVRYLGVPLHTAPLLVIGFFGLALGIAIHAGLFGLYLAVILGSWFFKYGFALLDDVVQGRSEPPVLSVDMANPVERRPLGLLLVLLVFYVLTGQLRPLIGDSWVGTLRIVLLALIPSMVASMSVTGRVRDAINPVAVLGTIMRIPIAYAALLIVIGVLWFVPFWALRALGESLPNLWRKELFLPLHTLSEVGFYGFFVGTLSMTLLMYLWLAMFACIGGTIYERRKELAVDAAAAPERIAARANAELERQRDKIMDRVFAEVRGGALANAGTTIRKLIEESRDPLDECRWLYARAVTLDSRLASYLAQLTLPRLIGAKATGEALKMLRERLAVDAEFRPLSGEQLMQLAQLARDAGDRAMARRLLADFNRHYPNHRMETAAAKLQSELVR